MEDFHDQTEGYLPFGRQMQILEYKYIETKVSKVKKKFQKE